VKVAQSKVAALLDAPPADCRAILVYGPDAGLVDERFDTACRAIVPDLGDPFLVANLTAQHLKEDPARLADEAAAIAMTGGKRVVRLLDATEPTTAPLRAFLDDPVGDALVVVSAGDLGPRSSLRRLFESSPHGAAVACYGDDAQSIDHLIHQTFRTHDVEVDDDAVYHLQAILGADRGVTRQELNKLALYAGAGGRLHLSDVLALVGDSGASSLDEVSYAALDGDAAALDGALSTAAQGGVTPVAILRAAAGHLSRAHFVKRQLEDGERFDTAVNRVRPPVFFKLRKRFERQTRHWSVSQLASAIALVTEAESNCKRTNSPARAICGRTLQQIAAMARRPG